MSLRSFGSTTVCVFASGAHLARDEVFLAAARLHLKPAALQSPSPVVALLTDDGAEADALLRDARDVNVDAWAVSRVELQRLEHTTRVTSVPGGAELSTPAGARSVLFSRLVGLVDLRWKAQQEVRVVVLQPGAGPALAVSAKHLAVDGPSRQAAVLKVHVELQQGAAAAVKERVAVHTLTPAQLGVPMDTPAEVVALGLLEGVRRKTARR
ncbi:MAG: hypothetical protein IAE78_05060 [Myxococcus sp.]|nr:hypothetical protein [Myxococcus sp.]